jgi:hypothetical protein
MEAGAAGPAQILAARGREHVAADLPHIDRKLADGIEQMEDPVARGDAAEARASFTSEATCWEIAEHSMRAERDAFLRSLAPLPC